MPFITTLDFSNALFREIRETITRYSDTLLLSCSLRAEQEIIARLSAKYHIKPELEKTGTDRNAMLVGVCTDIAIYYLYKTQETIPNIRVKAYDDAIALLRDIATGVANLPNVPPAPIEGAESIKVGVVAHGSHPKRDNSL
jgi:hypothetical protein